MSQCDKYECEGICFYCDAAVLPNRHEHDHFPVPRWLGGTEVVTACYTCHDLKDRIPFNNWSTAWYIEPILEVSRLLGDRPYSMQAALEVLGDVRATMGQPDPAATRLLRQTPGALVETDKKLYPTTLF
jgi:hypothetical protein